MTSVLSPDVLLTPCDAVREAESRIKAQGISLCTYAASICIQRIQKRLLGMIEVHPSTSFQRSGIERQCARPKCS